MDAPVERTDRAEERVRSMAAGAAAGMIGGLLAGIAARVAMRLFAVAIDQPVGFTVEGTLIIVVVGALGGAAFGILYAAVRRFLPGPWLVRGILFGAILIAAVLLPSFAASIDEAGPDPVLGAILFSGVTMVLAIGIAASHPLVDPRVNTTTVRAGLAETVALCVGVLSLAMVAPAILGAYLELVGRAVR